MNAKYCRLFGYLLIYRVSFSRVFGKSRDSLHDRVKQTSGYFHKQFNSLGFVQSATNSSWGALSATSARKNRCLSVRMH